MRKRLLTLASGVALTCLLYSSTAEAQGCRISPLYTAYQTFYMGGGCGTGDIGPAIGVVWFRFRFSNNGTPHVPYPAFSVTAYTATNGAASFARFVAAAGAPGVTPANLTITSRGCNGCELTSWPAGSALMNKREFVIHYPLSDWSEGDMFLLDWAPDVAGAPGAWAVLGHAPWPGGGKNHAAGPDCQPCEGTEFEFAGEGASKADEASAFLVAGESGTTVGGPALSGWWLVALPALLLGAGWFSFRNRAASTVSTV